MCYLSSTFAKALSLMLLRILEWGIEQKCEKLVCTITRIWLALRKIKIFSYLGGASLTL